MRAQNLVFLGLSPWPLTFAAVALLVAFMVWQYWWERWKRRKFCRSLLDLHSDTLVEPPSGAPASMLPEERNASSPSQISAEASASVPFPAFGTYFLDHLGRYSLVVLFVCLALLVRWLLEPALQGRLAYGFFLLAVIGTALVADIWETLLAVVLGFLMAVWFFVNPPGFGIGGPDGWWGAILYFLTGLGIVWFMASEHSAWLQTLERDIAYFDRLKELDRERAARRKQADRDLLAGIVDSARDAILGVTPQGRIATWNAAAEELFGFSASEAAGQPLSFVVPSEHRAELQRLLERIRRGEQVEEWHAGFNRKGGSRVEVSVVLSPIGDESGQFLGASVIARDRSPRR